MAVFSTHPNHFLLGNPQHREGSWSYAPDLNPKLGIGGPGSVGTLALGDGTAISRGSGRRQTAEATKTPRGGPTFEAGALANPPLHFSISFGAAV